MCVCYPFCRCFSASLVLFLLSPTNKSNGGRTSDNNNLFFTLSLSFLLSPLRYFHTFSFTETTTEKQTPKHALNGRIWRRIYHGNPKRKEWGDVRLITSLPPSLPLPPLIPIIPWSKRSNSPSLPPYLSLSIFFHIYPPTPVTLILFILHSSLGLCLCFGNDAKPPSS